MEDKLRRYVDGLFARTVPTKKAVELKEEMLQNLHDKYADLISEGKAPEAAYNIAIAGIGDVSSLLAELETEVPEPLDTETYESARNISAVRTSIAVVLIILSCLPLIILGANNDSNTLQIGIPVMFAAIAGATGLLIYNNLTKPRFLKGSDTMVEQFREWQSGTDARKALRRAISAALWSIITALYFIISFYTEQWNVTWIIFILGAAVEAIINLFFTLKK